MAAARGVIGDPARALQHAAAFREGALAETTRPVYGAYLRTLANLAEAGGFDLLPLTMDKVNLLGGALKAAGYRSIRNYLERYRRHHVTGGGSGPPLCPTTSGAPFGRQYAAWARRGAPPPS